MSYIGTNKVGKMFLGDVAIGKAYLGNDLVYSSDGGIAPILPYDTEIEYLESTGTQFIEIPFGFYKTDEIYMDFSIDLSMGNDKYMIAPKTWNNNNNRFSFGVMNTNKVFTAGYGSSRTGLTMLTPNIPNDGIIHNWQYKNYLFEVVDLVTSKDVSNITFGAATTNLKLFFGYNANTKGKIAYYKQIKDGQKVIELIPVRVGQVGYMYDKVSGQLFGNNGTGSFILGNDKTT